MNMAMKMTYLVGPDLPKMRRYWRRMLIFIRLRVKQ
jgi:hypothetical protein